MIRALVIETIPLSAITSLSANDPDVVVMAPYGREGNFDPISTVQALQHQYPNVKVLV